MNVKVFAAVVVGVAGAATALLSRVPAYRPHDRRGGATGPVSSGRSAKRAASRVFRLAVAKADPEALAAHLGCAGLNGTIFPGCIGFTAEWGIEPTVAAEIADPDWRRVVRAACEWLIKAGEQCAYLSVNGERPALLFADGRVETL